MKAFKNLNELSDFMQEQIDKLNKLKSNKENHIACTRCDELHHEDFINYAGLCEHCNDDLNVII